jgi:hypothetical protein
MLFSNQPFPFLNFHLLAERIIFSDYVKQNVRIIMNWKKYGGGDIGHVKLLSEGPAESMERVSAQSMSLPSFESSSSTAVILCYFLFYKRPTFCSCKTENKLYSLILRCSGQISWLQILKSGFDSGRYHIFCEVVSLDRGPCSLVSAIEELLGRKSSGSGLENREFCPKELSFWPRGTVIHESWY